MRALLLLALLPLSSFAGSGKAEFAYRNVDSPSESERRNVGIQGPRDGSFTFESACGPVAQKCECLFFRNESDNEPFRSASIGISVNNNSISCLIPGAPGVPDMIHQVGVRLRTGETVIDRMPLKTALVLEDILGSSLAKSKVRQIFRYTCQKTFFEGEGVGANDITCVGGQHLGVISADYHYYTFRSGEDLNLPGGDAEFPTDICKRNTFLKEQCSGNTPELRYGLYKDSLAPFVVSVQMDRAPNDTQPRHSYGYAAIPDTAGRCPLGLVKARAWVAQPASMIPNGPSCPAQGCPSNFINANSSLNDAVVETSQPMNFIVSRQPNAVPCAASGDCSMASFDGVQQAQSVMYTALTPVVCVIPPYLLTGFSH